MNESSIKNTLVDIHQKLLGQFKTQTGFYTVEQIQHQEGLPNQIKTFIIAEIEFSARAYLKHIHSPRFDFSHESLSKARNHFAKELMKTAKLSESDFSKYLNEAVLLYCRYLYEPQKVLSELIFGSKTEQDAQEIHDRLKNFYDYRYLTDVFLQYLHKKEIKSISLEKFQKIISDIDRKITQTYQKQDFLTLFKHIFNFFKLGSQDEVPMSLLFKFVQEKQLERIQSNFLELKSQGIESLSLQDIELAIDNKLAQIIQNATGTDVKEKFVDKQSEIVVPNLPEEKEVQDLVEEKPTEPEMIPVEPLKQEKVEAASIIDEPLPKLEEPEIHAPEKNNIDDDELAAEINAALADFKPVPKKKPTEKEDQKQPVDDELSSISDSDIFLDDTNVPFEDLKPTNFENDLDFLEKTQINSVPPPQPPPQPVQPPPAMPDIFAKKDQDEPAPKKNDKPLQAKDLRALISDSDRKRFIKKLFKGKVENFDQAISDINDKKSWREASVYIDDEIFTRYNIDEYTQDAVYFTDLVFERYQGRK